MVHTLQFVSAVPLSAYPSFLYHSFDIHFFNADNAPHPNRDRATYDPNLPTAVNYSVASPEDAPASLTYGPSFFDLAADLSGDVTIGFNRQLNNLSNTGAAALEAQDSMSNLYAIELGNEPDCEHRLRSFQFT